MQFNKLDVELLDTEQFAVQEPAADTLADGSFCHYYTDRNDGAVGPFSNSQWHKQLFAEQSFLDADIESFRKIAEGPVERRFMELALNARSRIFGSDDA
ncbi:hypothetical protein NOR51B_2173 [Luminiphilus syltensis NOR5-1B]|uniref:Uncharacterized protein n=2 Tax=Luminiphilus TaxID=1341118 RepID=B8KYM4_9GAMM|nr:hypothetical protein NOR51B_2173 [Luminiphilus syltensis NOR5-1B]